jgi:hypothetical protein
MLRFDDGSSATTAGLLTFVLITLPFNLKYFEIFLLRLPPQVALTLGVEGLLRLVTLKFSSSEFGACSITYSSIIPLRS